MKFGANKTPIEVVRGLEVLILETFIILVLRLD